MNAEFVPLSIRKIKHNYLVDYSRYLDVLIGSKLEELRRRKEMASKSFKEKHLFKTARI